MNIISKTRLYVTEALKEGAVVGCSSNQAHYLRSVLRLQAGDPVTLFNGEDGEWLGSIDGVGKGWASVSLERKLRDQAASPDLWLLFSPLKRSATDLVIQKATELGASRIVPVLTQRTNTERLKQDRAHATAIEAAEQCERLDVPEVTEIQKLTTFLSDWNEERLLYVCAEAGIADAVSKVFAAHQMDRPAAILIGPEGGFTEKELAFLNDRSFITPVSLGPRILRAETAALAALACWQSICGDWADRPPHRQGVTD
ncbi:16S rRNA (uracil(1498)-N(3))-methyltransferase [Aestuariispira insulae]|uniref:Ribosomal RNA small subunit methyltransferase E n=1 Tax=Aestuariispira insulae TaxID=1461337 RepID=A0A3D9H9H9_9PROT|nr:16S rRNA (uracil(1498)-N(3))-methyltransferase [Aestuariispira insulae]RED46152.1 16S rRNA (uracil1498-N3)-methyltransferase [Aestuariispira insulae]